MDPVIEEERPVAVDLPRRPAVTDLPPMLRVESLKYIVEALLESTDKDIDTALKAIVDPIYHALHTLDQQRDAEEASRDAIKDAPTIKNDEWRYCLQCNGQGWNTDELLRCSLEPTRNVVQSYIATHAALLSLNDIIAEAAEVFRVKIEQKTTLVAQMENHLRHQQIAAGYTGFVYLIDNASRQQYKIGWSRNPSARIAGLRTAIPDELELLSTFRGSPGDERALHAMFSQFRIRPDREWFRHHDSIPEKFGYYNKQRGSHDDDLTTTPA